MLEKSSYADEIIIVGGYKYSDLESYIEKEIPQELAEKITLVYNDHYSDLSSGYSLYLGIDCALNKFTDIDDESFDNVVKSPKNVLTFNHEPIYSNKAVVLYQNENDEYKYLFNSDHGLLSMTEAFKAIFNSGQTWKFQDMELLKIANDNFAENLIEDTNLGIIQKYFDLVEDSNDIDIIGLNHWVNCNTRKDYQIIKEYWRQ
jgi:CTP:phosphocholine cytidylyltransferase-like protein